MRPPAITSVLILVQTPSRDGWPTPFRHRRLRRSTFRHAAGRLLECRWRGRAAASTPVFIPAFWATGAWTTVRCRHRRSRRSSFQRQIVGRAQPGDSSRHRRSCRSTFRLRDDEVDLAGAYVSPLASTSVLISATRPSPRAGCRPRRRRRSRWSSCRHRRWRHHAHSRRVATGDQAGPHSGWWTGGGLIDPYACLLMPALTGVYTGPHSGNLPMVVLMAAVGSLPVPTSVLISTRRPRTRRGCPVGRYRRSRRSLFRQHPAASIPVIATASASVFIPAVR